MPAITGEVRSITGASLASRVAQLVFRLNAPNIGIAGAIESRVMPTSEVWVTPDTDTTFSVDLTQTDLMLTDAWYELGIVWQGSKEPLWDYPQWQIRVTGSGTLLDMIVLGAPQGGWGGPLANLSLVLISATRPPSLQVGQLWLQGDPDNPDSNTGDLFRGV